jgi:hypothetical protein
VRSNKSLERAVEQRGRTVRAFAVGARAGAESWSWPAVQRNRYTSRCASKFLSSAVPVTSHNRHHGLRRAGTWSSRVAVASAEHRFYKRCKNRGVGAISFGS